MADHTVSWTGLSGHRLQLTITGYQFPEIDEGHDGNWVTLAIHAENEGGEWRRHSSCLLTWELQWFQRWLEHVAVGAMASDCVTGMENDLELRYIALSKGTHRLAVLLRRGLARVVSEPARNIEVIQLALTPTQWSEAAAYFRAAFAAYPPRGAQGERAKALPGPKVLGR